MQKSVLPPKHSLDVTGVVVPLIEVLVMACVTGLGCINSGLKIVKVGKSMGQDPLSAAVHPDLLIVRTRQLSHLGYARLQRHETVSTPESRSGPIGTVSHAEGMIRSAANAFTVVDEYLYNRCIDLC
jgi:hypothetical protein